MKRLPAQTYNISQHSETASPKKIQDKQEVIIGDE